MKLKKLTKFIFVSLLSFVVLAACGSEESTSEGKENSSNSEGEVKKVKIAYPVGAKPLAYEDENGNLTGYEIEAMRLVDEKLEDYEFEFVQTTNDDLLVGVAQGKYDGGVKNAFFTEERLDTYVFPEEFLGLSSAGFVLRKEHEHIKSFSDFASAGLSLAPIDASDARYTVVQEYNEANPDNPIKLEANDGSTVDNILWVNEGRVDGSFYIGMIFDAQVTSKNGPYHHLKDELVYNEAAVIKTYPMFKKGQEELAKAYDEAMKEIKKTDALNKLMIEFYGSDLFELLDHVNR